jgi:CMP-N-acetylneuraminic acid synthetase
VKELGKIIAQIPARAGSKRVKAKNLRFIAGQPLLAYSVNAAIASSYISEVYVNSDSEDMLALGESLGAKKYFRKPELASDTATGDEFTVDFIEKLKPDTLVMVNPVCPLITTVQIDKAIEAFKHSDCDTLITCESTQMQTFCEGKAVNIDTESQLRPTQENPVISTLNWAVTVWDTKKFIENFNKQGYAYIGCNRLLFEIDAISGIKISHEADFNLCEAILIGRAAAENLNEPIYWTSKK